MYAIIKTGGKQYRVAKDDVIDVELLGKDAGATVEFSDVLFYNDGKKPVVGQPTVNGCTVVGEILGDSKGPKVVFMKHKKRKRQDKKYGHRQHYSKIRITEIKHGS